MLKTKKLSEVANIKTGKLDSNAYEKNGIYPFFTCAPEPLRINSFSFDDNVILLAGNNAAGNFHLNRYEGKFNAYQRTYIITPKEGYDIDYIYYSLKLVLSHFKKISQGSQTKFLTMQILDSFELEDLEYEKQKQQINLLKNLDKKIELNNKINKELEEMAKIIYDYWFVQFDFPDENGKPYKSSGGEMVWSKELKREIPKGWEVKNLKENSLTEIMKAGIEEFEHEKIYLPTACVDGVNIKDLSNKIFYKTRESRANMQPKKNSIWFAKMKKSKKIIAVGDYSDFYLKNLIFSTGFCGLQVKEEAFEYIYNFINRDEFEILKDRLATGATQEAINNERLSSIPLIIPELEVLKNFQKKTFNIHKKVYLNNMENQELESLRDWLLPMLMNGQVSIK